MNSPTKKSYTREEIARQIIDHNDLLVIHSNKIYRLNSWIKHHPGGDMVILHMVGKVSARKLKLNRMLSCSSKDATDEMNAYHSDEIIRTKLPLFYYGDVKNEKNEGYSSLNSPIQFDNQKNDWNNNRLLTSEALLTNDKDSMITNANEHKHIIQAYRQLVYKLRFLGR